MKALTMVLGLAAVFALALTAQAKEAAKGKEVTLKGKITCAKCDLKEKEYVDADKCETVIQVKDGDNTVTYYFDPSSHKANHKEVCQEAKDGTVTGTVTEKGGKKWIKVTDIKFE